MSLRSFLNEKVIEPILAQIKQGVTPRKLALSIAFGVALGIFPVIGVSILLCLLIGIPLKLNQPALQAVNLLMYPFQIPLVLVFVRLGEFLFQAPPLLFSVTELRQVFMANPAEFLRRFGMAGLHGIAGWLAVAPLLTAGVYCLVLPILKKIKLDERLALDP